MADRDESADIAAKIGTKIATDFEALRGDNNKRRADTSVDDLKESLADSIEKLPLKIPAILIRSQIFPQIQRSMNFLSTSHSFSRRHFWKLWEVY
ncbi:WSSV053 [White spot syndrome virus]|uniref:WSSV053 n=1 Tax=White spot syndrome virus TaxID=342409 RepID=A0A2I6SBJ5_9VIRU|nr:WSSV053 [White spot syndrome virus]